MIYLREKIKKIVHKEEVMMGYMALLQGNEEIGRRLLGLTTANSKK